MIGFSITIHQATDRITGKRAWFAIIQEDDPKTGWRRTQPIRISKKYASDLLLTLRNLESQIQHHKINRD